MFIKGVYMVNKQPGYSEGREITTIYTKVITQVEELKNKAVGKKETDRKIESLGNTIKDLGQVLNNQTPTPVRTELYKQYMQQQAYLMSEFEVLKNLQMSYGHKFSKTISDTSKAEKHIRKINNLDVAKTTLDKINGKVTVLTQEKKEIDERMARLKVQADALDQTAKMLVKNSILINDLKAAVMTQRKELESLPRYLKDKEVITEVNRLLSKLRDKERDLNNLLENWRSGEIYRTIERGDKDYAEQLRIDRHRAAYKLKEEADKISDQIRQIANKQKEVRTFKKGNVKKIAEGTFSTIHVPPRPDVVKTRERSVSAPPVMQSTAKAQEVPPKPTRRLTDIAEARKSHETIQERTIPGRMTRISSRPLPPPPPLIVPPPIEDRPPPVPPRTDLVPPPLPPREDIEAPSLQTAPKDQSGTVETPRLDARKSLAEGPVDEKFQSHWKNLSVLGNVEATKMDAISQKLKLLEDLNISDSPSFAEMEKILPTLKWINEKDPGFVKTVKDPKTLGTSNPLELRLNSFREKLARFEGLYTDEILKYTPARLGDGSYEKMSEGQAFALSDLLNESTVLIAYTKHGSETTSLDRARAPLKPILDEDQSIIKRQFDKSLREFSATVEENKRLLDNNIAFMKSGLVDVLNKKSEKRAVSSYIKLLEKHSIAIANFNVEIQKIDSEKNPQKKALLLSQLLTMENPTFKDMVNTLYRINKQTKQIEDIFNNKNNLSVIDNWVQENKGTIAHFMSSKDQGSREKVSELTSSTFVRFSKLPLILKTVLDNVSNLEMDKKEEVKQKLDKANKNFLDILFRANKLVKK